MQPMHEYTEDTEELARAIVAYARDRIAKPAAARSDGLRRGARRRAPVDTISPDGIGWEEALRVWAEVLAPATISTDHPASFAFVPGAPTKARRSCST